MIDELSSAVESVENMFVLPTEVHHALDENEYVPA
jgi:hypothetical protein